MDGSRGARRYDKEYLLWQSTVAIKSDPVGTGENEIDLVCDDSVGGRLDFYEVKRDASRIDLKRLKEKSVAFFQKNPSMKDRTASFDGLSLRDMCGDYFTIIP